MSDTNIEKVSSASFLWQYSIDRAEVEEMAGKQLLNAEWYALADRLDDAIASILSAL